MMMMMTDEVEERHDDNGLGVGSDSEKRFVGADDCCVLHHLIEESNRLNMVRCFGYPM